MKEGVGTNNLRTLFVLKESRDYSRDYSRDSVILHIWHEEGWESEIFAISSARAVGCIL